MTHDSQTRVTWHERDVYIRTRMTSKERSRSREAFHLPRHTKGTVTIMHQPRLIWRRAWLYAGMSTARADVSNRHHLASQDSASMTSEHKASGMGFESFETRARTLTIVLATFVLINRFLELREYMKCHGIGGLYTSPERFFIILVLKHPSCLVGIVNLSQLVLLLYFSCNLDVVQMLCAKKGATQIIEEVVQNVLAHCNFIISRASV